MKSQITAKIVGDSLSPQSHRLTTLEIVFPRIILAELNTHRILSKNSASSRAIPFKKMVSMVRENPFIPMAWQIEHKGMQGTEYLTAPIDIAIVHDLWLDARNKAVNAAMALTESCHITKQIANRALEPFMLHKVLISGTEWENFFQLRCPQYSIHSPTVNSDGTPTGKSFELISRSRKDLLKEFKELSEGNPEVYNTPYSMLRDLSDLGWLQLNKGQAEIHMMALAEAIWDSMNESVPKQLQAGEWHIPYEDQINEEKVDELDSKYPVDKLLSPDEDATDLFIKISTGMAARVSYTTVGDEKEISYESLIGIHDKMVNARPLHASPMEHCSQVPTQEEYERAIRGDVNWFSINQPDKMIDPNSKGWFKNYHGFKQYRQILEEQGIV